MKLLLSVTNLHKKARAERLREIRAASYVSSGLASHSVRAGLMSEWIRVDFDKRTTHPSMHSGE